MNIAEALRREGIAPLDARALLRAILQTSDAHIAAHPEQPLSEEQRGSYLALAERRSAGEPVAYLTGQREFYSLAFKVTPEVLIPRPETELLVDLALERVAPGRALRVLDLGTGSGCIAIAIARNSGQARVTATDVSGAAIALARANAARHGAGVRFVESDWFAALADKRFDVIVTNPPYVAAGDPHLREGDARFEPQRALVAGPTGYECIETLVAQSPRHLEPGAWLLFEHGYDQAPRCRELLARAGYQGVFSAPDLAGIERVSGGRV